MQKITNERAIELQESFKTHKKFIYKNGIRTDDALAGFLINEFKNKKVPARYNNKKKEAIYFVLENCYEDLLFAKDQASSYYVNNFNGLYIYEEEDSYESVLDAVTHYLLESI